MDFTTSSFYEINPKVMKYVHIKNSSILQQPKMPSFNIVIVIWKCCLHCIQKNRTRKHLWSVKKGFHWIIVC